jgi:hypothetical protein
MATRESIYVELRPRTPRVQEYRLVLELDEAVVTVSDWQLLSLRHPSIRMLRAMEGRVRLQEASSPHRDSR